ncbi:hypothetical protein [Streptomyces avicenniae]|uniref:hypothetical protein n=1 Tax=Streptomyces avicenniae TaxID=500153 RepID=UPI000AE0A559|nr:hypothetical protein [Streptomyces avicenniae]
MHIGITGHRGLSAEIEQWVRDMLSSRLADHAGDLVGVSCLADGPDAWFAEIVLELGGRIEVVVPSENYRTDLPDWHRPVYDDLLSRAADVHRTGLADSNAEAHMAGSVILVGLVDQLLAVWDGLPARGFGGTADVVVHAEGNGVPVTVVWPEGATRD